MEPNEKSKRATEEFMSSIINGKAFAFPVEFVKDSDQDKMLRNHPMFHKAMIKESDNFKNNIKDNRDEEE